MTSYFPRLIGVIYFLTFTMIWAQVPIHDDRLTALYFIGTWLSIFLIAGRFNIYAMSALWFTHWLVFRSIYSWVYDYNSTLILEVGFITIFLFCRKKENKSWAYWLFLWLIFRLMFECGISKILHPDATLWKNLLAIKYFAQFTTTPCLIGWIIHQMPDWVHRWLTLSTLVIETIVAFLIFFGRLGRKTACILFVGLQIGIILIGAIGTFNYLAILLFTVLLWKRPKFQLPSGIVAWVIIFFILWTGTLDIFKVLKSSVRKEKGWQLTYVYRPFRVMQKARTDAVMQYKGKVYGMDEERLPLLSLLPSYMDSALYWSAVTEQENMVDYFKKNATYYKVDEYQMNDYKEWVKTGKFWERL